MKYLLTLASAVGLLASVSATPVSSPTIHERDVQTVHLTFHGGPAQYTLTLPADGTVHPTSNPPPIPYSSPIHPSNPPPLQTDNGLTVSIIDAPDYNAFYNCQFHHAAGGVTLVSSISPTGANEILVGPPTPITGVSCQGFCVQTYGDCYDSHGQFVGPCCAGYCAANKCRPWVNPF